MTKYKLSGVEWIGQIPEDWGVGKLKWLAQNIASGGTPDTNNESYYNEDGVCWASISDMTTNGEYLDKTSKHITNEAIASKNLTIFPANTILYSMYASVGKTLITRIETTCSQAILGITPVKNSNIKFMKYSLYALQDYAFSNSNGNTQFNLNAGKVRNFELPTPTLEEQVKIADTLDLKCSQIDRLIEIQNEEIEKLKEYKTSLITEVVTKGLDENAVMKDSGVEWIGQIPEDWEVYPIKKLFGFAKGLPITKEDLVEEGLKVISYGQIHAKYNKFYTIDEQLFRFVEERFKQSNESSIVKAGDFIFADTSEDIPGTGDFIHIDRADLIFAGYHTIILQSRNTEFSKYLAYLFMSSLWRDQLRCRVSGVKLFSLTKKILSQATVILPPKDIREQIVAHITKRCDKIDDLINFKNKKIEELKEYKKSMIYEYVTGKRRV